MSSPPTKPEIDATEPGPKDVPSQSNVPAPAKVMASLPGKAPLAISSVLPASMVAPPVKSLSCDVERTVPPPAMIRPPCPPVPAAPCSSVIEVAMVSVSPPGGAKVTSRCSVPLSDWMNRPGP